VAQARLSVRKIREVLRLRAEGYSEREIAHSVGCARSSVQICLWRAERVGLSWPLPAELDDAALQVRLYPRRPPGVEVHPAPDFQWIDGELKRKHVTRGSCGASTWRSTPKDSSTPPFASSTGTGGQAAV
jgi:hypothetical protein